MRCSTKIAIGIITGIVLAIVGTLVGIHFTNDSYSKNIDKLDKLKPIPTKWENLTLMDMNIRCSHNSYLNSFQHLSLASTDAVVEALDMGARSLELDIMNKDGDAYVAHGSGKIETTTSVPLKNMLRVIAANAFKQLDDPLIIFLEIYETSNSVLCSSIKRDLIDVFGQRLRFFNNLHNKTLAEMKLKDLQGNIIVTSNSKNQDLNEVLERRYECRNVGSEDPNSKVRREGNVLWRVFPENRLSPLSVNIDSLPFLGLGFNLVAMNFGSRDKHLYEYLEYFGPFTMVPKVA